ncbi:NUDIX domain-containing protein [Streptosporangium subroseum]|uniref:NUDIX domain-containing protein n=1 Tax=Streptosporangium subroseum TaxID=106412 RepID=UPI003420C8FE
MNEDATYFWHEAPVPADLEVTQVYGYLICPDTARVLVQEYEGEFNLPGGSPEPEDADLAATLVREAMEESQVVVSAPVYLGYQEVHQPGLAPYAQVRMTGLIAAFTERRPDPDGGRVRLRLMVPLVDAPGILGWGEPAVAQAKAAARVAEEAWRLPVTSPAPAGYVD